MTSACAQAATGHNDVRSAVAEYLAFEDDNAHLFHEIEVCLSRA